MIVAGEADHLRVVTQGDHAALAAQLLSLWRRDGLPDSPRREALLLATREHDNGWLECDSAPRVDPESSQPYDFLTLPAGERQELWERGTCRYLDGDPYVALLIVEHGLRLHQALRQLPSWSGFFEPLDERQLELSERAAIDGATIDADYRLLALADTLSLILCGALSGPLAGPDYSGRLDEASHLRLTPLPFAGATTFELPCRRIPRRAYRGDADLGVALATARWETLACRVAPG